MSSGKVDRAALPEPEKARFDFEPGYVPPKTELEQTIAAIWQEVLNIENPSIHDNFFDIGGHSLPLSVLIAG